MRGRETRRERERKMEIEKKREGERGREREIERKKGREGGEGRRERVERGIFRREFSISGFSRGLNI